MDEVEGVVKGRRKTLWSLTLIFFVLVQVTMINTVNSSSINNVKTVGLSRLKQLNLVSIVDIVNMKRNLAQLRTYNRVINVQNCA